MSGQTVVDPKGYLTDLNSMIPTHGGDIRYARWPEGTFFVTFLSVIVWVFSEKYPPSSQLRDIQWHQEGSPPAEVCEGDQSASPACLDRLCQAGGGNGETAGGQKPHHERHWDVSKGEELQISLCFLSLVVQITMHCANFIMKNVIFVGLIFQSACS